MSKPKANKKQQQPRRPNRRKTRPRQAIAKTPRPNQALVSKVCAHLDPFCSHAKGSKYMDRSSTLSLSLPYRSVRTLSTDSTGAASTLYLPSYNYTYATASGLTGTVASYTTATSFPRLGGVASYRIVSMGIIIRHISTPLNSSGMVRVRGFSSPDGQLLTALDTQTYASDFQCDIPLSEASEVAITFKPLDNSANLWHAPGATNPTANVADWVAPGWGAINVAVLGGPASAGALDIEYVCNYEVTFPDGDSLALLATPAARYDPLLEDAISDVKSTAKNVFIEGAKQLANYTIKTAVTAIGARFGGAAGARNGYALAARVVD